MTKIGYIVGSIAEKSLNRSLAGALVHLAPEGVELVELEIKNLPFYSVDAEADFPQVASDFKAAIEGVDGVIIVTPEYNRSIPGVLKNAIEWASRPYGDFSFSDTPVAVIGASPGAISTAAAQQHLKAILSHVNAIVMGQPEGFIQVTPGLIDADGTVTNEGTRAFLEQYLGAFLALVGRVQKARA
ncbi:NAD(P)H-dependent oxidoreductase [Microbacterium excoecariae]|uniref:NAD(P)H-dependent oxidoreductase n=1 Tax=Microbacterium excoecariae TaxID=2715210 RepID=UPI00140C9432|nr:NAD(P)H-dependent oxidoreductase [Microbacterium excoecariae]